MVTYFQHIHWKTSLVTNQVSEPDFDHLFATPKQKLDGTSQFEHYLSESQFGRHVDPREYRKVREKSYTVLALLAKLYLRCPASSDS
ncbi:hypothetical protein PR048_025047 [Dryococelus australis]|uniref:Uncharacterized protein n=1 Tax=Dryococelus australis TaxID=614101 RepID=A0ABQ9GQA2_9NEOP|nr:hypothetical protein PR048_025047 [Dryococelus australis]